MWGDFYAYLNSLGPQWFAVVGTSVPFVINESLRSSDRYRAVANRIASQENRRLALFLLVLLSVFFAGFMAWRDEHLALAETQAKLEKAVSKRVSGLLECSHTNLPSAASDNISISILDVGSPQAEPLGFGQRMPSPKGQKWEWSGIERAYRCDFTNTGSDPVSNVLISFDVAFFETEKIPNNTGQTQMQKVLQRSREARIPNVLQGAKFSFYAYNVSNCYVTVDVRKDASYENSNGERDTLKLNLGRYSDMSMPPLKIVSSKSREKPRCDS